MNPTLIILVGIGAIIAIGISLSLPTIMANTESDNLNNGLIGSQGQTGTTASKTGLVNSTEKKIPLLRIVFVSENREKVKIENNGTEKAIDVFVESNGKKISAKKVACIKVKENSVEETEIACADASVNLNSKETKWFYLNEKISETGSYAVNCGNCVEAEKRTVNIIP